MNAGLDEKQHSSETRAVGVESHQIDNKLVPVLMGEAIPTPGPMDVICGRGKSVSHPGNQRFRRLILAKKEAYQKAKRRDEKTRITFEIVVELRRGSEPSRFVLKDPKTKMWHDTGDEYAREKVSHALRSRPNEDKPKLPKPKKKLSRKPPQSHDLEDTVRRLIADQQRLLKSMIEKDVFPGGQMVTPKS